MTTNTKIARTKLNLLQLAKDLGNVSKACRYVGYSRQQFYEIRRNFQVYGADGLLDRVRGPKGAHPNRVSEELEKSILDYSLKEPTHGPVRVADQLRLQGHQVSSGGVRGVWARHNLLSRHDRLLRLEKAVNARRIELTAEQVAMLERFSPEFRDRHIRVHYTGELVAVDTFMVGSLKGIGRIYLQAAIDCYSRYAWGRLYTNKMPINGVQLLNNDVLPFFEKHKVKVKTVLSDNGREFCGRLDTHAYELFLLLEDIEHRKTKVRRPQSNGFIERFNRTLLDEHFRVMGRKKFYESVEEMQKDLDKYLKRYNYERTHRGRNMNGRTPFMVFKQGIKKQNNKNLKKVRKAA